MKNEGIGGIIMRVKISNWRCIENLELELGRINLFIGRNGTGKSSCAYALYFLSKAVKWQNIDTILMYLYGYNIEKLIRIDNDRPCYPMNIEVDDMSLHAYIEDDEVKVDFSKESLWSDEYILPSRRLAYIQVTEIISRIMSEMKPSEREFFGPMLAGFIRPFLEKLPLFPPAPAFLNDLTRAVTGLEVLPVKGGLKTTGSFVLRVVPLISMFNFIFEDKYTQLKFPLGLSPDGQIDVSLISTIIQKALKGSLVVIEEPDICKNPLAQIELTRFIAKAANKKNLTIVMTTHSEIMPLALTKLVEDKILLPKDIKIYYFKRKPWTRTRLIKVYDDGTLEGLPDSEEATVKLF